MRKTNREDMQTLAELSSVQHRLQTKCQLIKTCYIKQPWSPVQPSLHAECTHDLSQDSPMHTSCSANKS